MDKIHARRHFLAVSVGGMASLAGCQSFFSSEISVVVHVLNATERNQDAYLELTRPADETFQRGRVLPIDTGIVETVNFTVPSGTYQMMLTIDDVEPRPEKTVEWEVTDTECARERYWAIIPSETGISLQLTKPSCDNTE